MHRNWVLAGGCALASLVVAAASFSHAASDPATQDQEGYPAQVTRIRTLPAVTEANADQVVQQALQGAARGEAKDGHSSPVIDRVFDYPFVTLKRLVPYATDPNDDVRSFVASVAAGVLGDGDPAVVGLQGRALSMLCTIAADAERASAYEALSSLAKYLIFSSDAGLRAKVDLGLLERALVHHLSNGYRDEEAALLLTLLPPDPKLKPLVESVAKGINYQEASVIALAHWNDAKGIAAIEEKIKQGDINDIKYFTERAAAIDHPAVLSALWNRFDDKRPTQDWGAQKPPRVCDYILAGFKLKFDHKYSGEFPQPVADAALTKAKARYRVLIDALPTPNAPPA